MVEQAVGVEGEVVEYRCADGTPFPVRFVEADDADREWRLEREHLRGCVTPLADTVVRLSKPGAVKAYAEAGLPYPSMWREGPHANGWPYYTSRMPEGEEMAQLVEGCAALVQKFGSTLSIWHDLSLPRVKESCEWLQNAPPDTPLAVLAERAGYAQHHTMISAFVAGNDMQLVTAVIADLYGEEAPLVAYELSQGYENETLRADQELWRLAQIVAGDDGLSRAVAAADPKSTMDEHRARGTHAEFFAVLDTFLNEYGWRAESWCIDDPTWREQGAGFWAQLRQLGRPGTLSPEEAVQRAKERREALIVEIEEKLRDDVDRQAKFGRRVERLASYVPVREERALWQLITTGSLRSAILRRGEHLVDRGVLAAAGDVVFLTPGEYDDPTSSAAGTVERGRADFERWRTVQPPARIGPVGDDPEPVTEATLRGVAASRGTAKGTARVITDIADGDRLEPGDVLVCQMTAPPWTPLFGLAAAVVTDAGDIGSHPSIAAREYGIPCVVGTEDATTKISDGAQVIVDGTTGTVQIQ